MAYDSATHEYLVVWSTADSVQGQRLSSAGAHLGGVISIAAGYTPPPGGLGWYYDQPAVAYASTSAQYLIVYRYRADLGGGTSIRALDMSGSGTPGSIFEVGAYDTVKLPEVPDLAYNRSRDEFLVVWQELVVGDIDVYGRRVKMNGGADVLGNAFPIANYASNDEVNPAVAAIPTVSGQGQYMVVWEMNGDVWRGAVSWDGVPGTWLALADTPWGEYRPSVAGSEYGDQFLVTWTWVPVVTPPAMMQVQGRTLALDGTPLLDTVFVGGGQVFDSATVSGSGGDFLVAFDDNEVFGTSNRGIYGRLWGTGSTCLL